jgi:hypothetical protein
MLDGGAIKSTVLCKNSQIPVINSLSEMFKTSSAENIKL